LPDHNRGQSGESGWPLPDVRHARLLQDGAKPGIAPHEFPYGVFEISLRAEMIDRAVLQEASLFHSGLT
jgi:hypothetical protein